MKTEGEVHRKLQQVRFRHLKKELEARLAQDPANCSFWRNESTCIIQVNAPCHRQPNNALTCGLFELEKSKERLKDELKDFFRNRPAAEIAVRFPDVAALMWVLDGSTPPDSFFDEFREEELNSQLAAVRKELEETEKALSITKDDNTRLKAALYDREARSFTAIAKDQERERADLVQGYAEEIAKLRQERTEVALPTPWYLSIFRRIFK